MRPWIRRYVRYREEQEKSGSVSGIATNCFRAEQKSLPLGWSFTDPHVDGSSSPGRARIRVVWTILRSAFINL
jgi:hypothetical protein